jgi:uncharacterized protein Yka (UPF0111/DUF47 family)
MGRWFLPESPDVLGMLCKQLDTTLEGMAAFAAWAHGDAAQSDVVRDCEHRADDDKRALWRSLRTAFVTPIDAEDLFVLSAGLDEILNAAKNAVREADVMGLPPDDAVAAMADLLVDGVRHLGEAFTMLGAADGDATEAADAAVKCERAVEKVYRTAMPALFTDGDLRDAIGRRELYDRLIAISEQMRMVAERVWYAVVKEA